MKLEVCSVFILVASINAGVKRYENYKIYRVFPTTDEQLQELKDLEFDFWKRPTTKNVSVNIIITPKETEEFHKFVQRTKIKYELRVSNLQQLVKKRIRRTNRFDWTDYHSLYTIYNWLDSLPPKYPNVSVVVIGKSYEGRIIKGVKISHKKNNKAVILEGGLHAREWISPATVTFILNQLLTSSNPAIRDISETYDWHIFPILNPDGYQYTFTDDRLWRKTRKPYSDDCYGVDPNRNWPYRWLEKDSSRDPCKNTYAGPAPFSEPEIYAFAEYITSFSENLLAYLSFHSYGQQLLLPYGHDSGRYDNYYEAKQIGQIALHSLESRYGTKYDIGNIAEQMGSVTGSSIDWVKYNFETPLVYAFELRDTGHYGFELLEEEIIPTGQEIMDSVVTLMKEAKRRGLSPKT